ncbi:hypothetical protein [Lactiplantibacillus mudanjiangensis]|uniref:Uncharacterized protein n=1 Tax=Lactiplantibacillus mudanjiangensis TaxID=1296538 RepID=A0A660E5S7_9LACO|nr:hypothetical protein [Lactiplantibacillus mudanjiangensis]VDG18846.1 hypothetical protein [Lactobacillus pentosus] [Lactiplantibacillus mudanjiangensis]VDG25375.1 hypothetical protein [Lactobacillus pentosus] [Lactiplantibacillus mudanjiangensis]VDG27594.1 hypothetical protein [Lactobacillus pentosus] [Lactiplantibacillus mudanjiangensis]VDG32945.1 hypothetical protein [Lactobacillus pentosus] [Lactiplantibacillus mudanjiangensis]
MDLTTTETDYLLDLLTTKLFELLSRVTRWQTHSLSQAQYDQQVEETLQPNLTILQGLLEKLSADQPDAPQVIALQQGLDKLQTATTYQLTTTQLAQANAHRFNRHHR